MDNDDRQIGRILSRREALALLGAAGGALLVARATETFGSTTRSVSAQAAPTVATTPMSYLPLVAGPEATATTAPTATPGTVPACVVRPEVTEGPYFVDEGLNRSDIRSDPGTGVVKDGALLLLTFNVSQIASS